MVERRLPARYLIGVELLLCQNMVSCLYLPGMILAMGGLDGTGQPHISVHWMGK